MAEGAGGHSRPFMTQSPVSLSAALVHPPATKGPDTSVCAVSSAWHALNFLPVDLLLTLPGVVQMPTPAQGVESLPPLDHHCPWHTHLVGSGQVGVMIYMTV